MRPFPTSTRATASLAGALVCLLLAAGCGSGGVADATGTTPGSAPATAAGTTPDTAVRTGVTGSAPPATETTTTAPPTTVETTVPPTPPPTTPAPTLPPTVPRPPRPRPPKPGRPAPPQALALLGAPAFPGEGEWAPAAAPVDGAPALYTTVVRSTFDASPRAAIAWIDTTVVKGMLFPGNQQPSGSWSVPSHVPGELVPSLLATFNGGFVLNESEGGFYLDGQAATPMRDGNAGLHVATDGTVTVGMLGRDFAVGPDTAAVRQNLPLLVDRGAIAASATDRDTVAWGKTLGKIPNVWRSGIGQRDDGTLVYVAGPAMSARTLANLLVAGGAVNAMELDINPQWVTFNVWTDGHPTKLLPEMTRAADRYLGADDRDFFALLARPPA